MNDSHGQKTALMRLIEPKNLIVRNFKESILSLQTEKNYFFQKKNNSNEI